MSKILVLAEKPSVGRDLAKVLKCNSNKGSYIEGSKYIVTWAMGHLVGLMDPEGYDNKYKEWKNDQIRKNRFQMCADQRTQFMSEEVSQEFRDLLQLCSNQLYLDEDGMVKQKKKKL